MVNVGNRKGSGFVSGLVGERLREIRESNGQTQTEFGELLGFSRDYIGQIELGRSGVSVDQIMVIADLLAIEPSALLPSLTRYRVAKRACSAPEKE